MLGPPEASQDAGIDDDFWDKILKAQAIQAKTDRWYYIKLRSFYIANEKN